MSHEYPTEQESHLYWCFTVIRNAAYHARKKVKRIRTREISFLDSPYALLDKTGGRGEDFEVELQHIIDSLPSEQSTVLRCLFFRGDTQQDVANALLLTQQKVSRIKNRALRNMAKELLDC